MASREWDPMLEGPGVYKSSPHDNAKNDSPYVAIPSTEHIPVTPQDKPTTQPSYPSVLSPRAWLYEIASLALAIAVLAALAGILGHFDDQPNPQWSTVTLPTIVSIASLLFRGGILASVATCISQLKWIWLYKGRRALTDTILFDQASRGGWGSVRILFSSAYRSTVSVGVVVTITALAVGPFFQQCLVFYSKEVLDPSLQAYASSAFAYSGNAGNRGTEPGDEIPFNMRTSAIRGLLASGLMSPPTPPFSCPTGNCTWDPFATLAISSRCRTISDRYTMNCTSPSSPDRPNCNVVAVDASEGNVTSIVSLNVNATNLLDNENPIVLYMASEYQSAETTLDAENWPVKPSGIVLNMAWLRVSTLNRFTEDGYFTPYIAPNSTIEAMRCTLYTAVQEIHARVEKGTTYMENTTDEIISAKYEEREANKLSYIYEYAPSGRPPKNFSITSFQQQVLFDGIKLSMPQENGGFGGGVVTIGHNGVLAGMEQSAPPLIPALLYQAKDIFQSVRSLAHYMTVSMRANDTILAIENGESPRSFDAGFGPGFVAPSHRVEGKVFASVIHVEVRWWWLAMPAVLTILAFVLLVTTIVESYRGRVAIWKDSPLALLLNTHWEPGLERRGEGTVTAADIANEVKGLKATFVTGREGSEEKGMKYDRRILVSAS